MKFRERIWPKKPFREENLQKKLFKFGISTLEYSFALSFISNKSLWHFGAKFPPPNPPPPPPPKKKKKKTYFRDVSYENNCRIQNLHPPIPLPQTLFCAEVYSKQSTLKFCDQICPKKGIVRTGLKKLFLNSKPAALNFLLYRVLF